MEPSEFSDILINIDENPELREILIDHVKSNVKLIDNSYGDYYGGSTTLLSVDYKGHTIDSFYDSSASRTCWEK